jgi:hypothetical protein
MKQKFKKQFAKRVFTRFHMILILLGTILSGVIFSKILLIAGLYHIIARFILVLIFAYVCFFILMKLWLHYLTEPYRRSRISDNLMDAADAITSIPDFSPTSSASNISGHGGDFGGGGASGSWTEVGGMAAESASTVGDTAAEAAGEAVSGIADEGGIILIPLIILLIVLFGGSIYLIYEAPVIFSEAAFELVLATTLVKKAKSIDNPNWMGSVFRATWPAFALTLGITVIAGWAIMSYCPQAIRIIDAFRNCI